jgi:hypothetical protein
VPNVANMAHDVGTHFYSPGESYFVNGGEQTWERHPWAFAEYFSTYMKNVSTVPVTIGVAEPANLVRVANFSDVLTYHTSVRLSQPTPPTPRPTHTGAAYNEREWEQMGQPSGFRVSKNGDDTWGPTYGVTRKRPSEVAMATAAEFNLPVFNSQSGCHERRHNTNPFDRPVASARYSTLPNYMWDHLMRSAADCAHGCGSGSGCVAQSV